MTASGNVSVRPPGSGDEYWVVGDLHTLKATGKDTGGSYALVEILVSPGKGPPLHTHTREDEAFYILIGEIEFTVGDRIIRARQGTFLHAPKNIPHRFTNPTTSVAKMQVWVFPAGFEQYFIEAGDPVTDPSGPAPEPNIDKLLGLAPKYGLTLHLSPE